MWLLLMRREFLAERRSLGWVGSAGLLAIQEVIILGFGFSSSANSPVRSGLAMAAVWLAFLFAGAVGIGRAYAGEAAGGAMTGVLLLPVSRGLIYLSKVCFGAIFLSAALLVMLASGRLFLGFGPEVHSLPMLALVGLTAVGYLAPGMLVGAMTSRLRGRDAMLAVALLPLMIPLFLAATGAGQTIIGGGGFGEIASELTILGSFTCLYLAAGAALFGRVVE